MIRSFCFTTLCVVAAVAVWTTGCSTGTNAVPVEIVQALEQATSFELYSLDPSHLEPDEQAKAKEADALLIDWRVLGKTEVADATSRKNLLAALQRGVSENHGTVAACFNPRHAIRVKHHGKAIDIVICFECFQVSTWIDGKRSAGFLTTDSPQSVFDAALQKAGVPLADPAH